MRNGRFSQHFADWFPSFLLRDSYRFAGDGAVVSVYAIADAVVLQDGFFCSLLCEA